MLTRLCRFLPPNRRPLQTSRKPRRTAGNTGAPRGQVLVVFAISLLALLAFVGLAVDAASVYLTYGQLKRAVDAAAVAAANDFKRTNDVIDLSTRLTLMNEAAKEVLKAHNLDTGAIDMDLYICDSNGDTIRDANLQVVAPQFYARCPSPGEDPRKLVWIDATMNAPLYFLHMVGFQTVPLTTNAIAEAAPIDLVIVLDVSESMGNDTLADLCAGLSNCPYIGNFDPNGGGADGCNLTNSCQPLRDAKDAAKRLIASLYDGYDRVAIVTFDSIAMAHPIYNHAGNQVTMSDYMDEAQDTVDTFVRLHDEPPMAKMWVPWARVSPLLYNPGWPEDRDGDGSDADPALPCTLDEDRWDQVRGIPCDADSLPMDAYDWNGDGVWTSDDESLGAAWLATMDPDGPTGPLYRKDTPVSTCLGCGLRTASNILQNDGRAGAVWVMVVLSDGIPNMTDTPVTTFNEPTERQIPSAYSNGFCPGSLGAGSWRYNCRDWDPEPRICIEPDRSDCYFPCSLDPADPVDRANPFYNATLSATCWDPTLPSSIYSPIDYALDEVDAAALTASANPDESPGNDIAIYSIGLGQAATDADGRDILRYLAAVGDDGDRLTDPCVVAGVPVASNIACGQYYPAATGADLDPIFEDIATRIYTRITE